jgi:hypothetical protein
VGTFRRTVNLLLDLGSLFFILKYVSAQNHFIWFSGLFVAEWLFGLSPGKLISFSRTRTADGEHVGLIQTAWRNLIKYAILATILWIAHDNHFADYITTRDLREDFFFILILIGLLALWRPCIKLVDTITGCRVVSW